jgi:hypothetical protein
LRYTFIIILLFLSSCDRSEQKEFSQLKDQTEKWHKERIDRLTSPYGWLSLTGFYWFDENIADNDSKNKTYKIENIKETFFQNGDSIFAASDNNSKKLAYLFNKDTIIQERFYDGSKQYYVVERDSKFALRVKDSLATTRAAFKGIERFPFNEEMIFEAKLYILDISKEFILPNKMGYEQKEIIRYRMDFSFNGRKHSLYPIKEGDSFFVVFSDPTNGETTYEACRYLYTSLPDDKGKVLINFNQAYNPPCAFTEFATCPLPPKENYLDFDVNAGERSYKNL